MSSSGEPEPLQLNMSFPSRAISEHHALGIVRITSSLNARLPFKKSYEH